MRGRMGGDVKESTRQSEVCDDMTVRVGLTGREHT